VATGNLQKLKRAKFSKQFYWHGGSTADCSASQTFIAGQWTKDTGRKQKERELFALRGCGFTL